jgi:Mg-chelatase subunit ChlD/predicted kinase
MSDAFNNNTIELELQVRLMNLVLGEASDFERDQLQEMMDQRSELADYYQQLQHLHGLLCEVGAGDPSVEFDASTAEEAWQLPADRREKVLAVLDKQSPNLPDRVTLATKGEPTRWRSRMLGAVAVASIACVLIVLLIPSVQSSREAARRMSASPREKMSLEVEQIESFSGVYASDLRQPDTRLAPSMASSSPGQFARPAAPSARSLAPGSSAGSARVLNDRSQMSTNGPTSPQVNLDSSVDQPQALEDVNEDRYHLATASPIRGTGVGGPGGFGGGGGGSRGLVNDRPNALGVAENALLPQSTTENFADPPQKDFGSDRADFGSLYGQTERDSSAPAKPAMQWSVNNGMVNDLSQSIESPKSEDADWESSASDRSRISLGLDTVVAATKDNAPASEPSLSFTVPDGGRVLLGGIARTREQGQGDHFDANRIDQSDASYTLMFSVTPRILIPEEEERNLVESQNLYRNTQSADGEKPSRKNPDGDRKKGGMAGSSEPVDGIKPSSDFRSRNRASLSMGLPSEDNRKTTEDGKTGITNKSTRDWDESKEGLSDDDRSQKAYSELVEKQKSLSTQGIEKTNEDTVWKRAQKSSSTRLAIPTLIPAPSPELVTPHQGVQDKNLAGKPVAPPQTPSLDEQSATNAPFSTFSLHVSDVSFKLAQAALSQGQWPDATQIRIEDFVNALDYRDPLPSGKEKVACRIEQAIHPFLMQRNLLRVSMRTAATGRSQKTPLRLTLLLDNSGSMERPDRRQAVLRAFQTLTQQLSAADQITLISFANKPRLLADKVPGNQGESLLQLIENLPSEGGTNIEAGLVLAHEKAAEQQLTGAQNRIVLLTDGAVNLGDANPDSLARLITQMRDSGIAFDAAGISAQDLNDQVLEALTRQGDGRYYLLDSAADAGERFAAQIAGALRPSAQNVKVQIEFNPERVGHYKLLGFEKHRLQKEDFRNDRVDAAEMAAAEAGVAVYQFEIKPNGRGDVGNVSVRFRDVSTGQMVERRWPIPYESNAPRLEQADPSLQLAAAAALFATKLAGGPLADSVDLAQLQNVLTKLPERVASQPRVQQLRAMIDQAKAIGH